MIDVPYAREVLTEMPTEPTPATEYFIRTPDGTLEHWISDLAPPYTLRRVSGAPQWGSLWD